ncbi:MAG: DUF2283 domain-containing protein [Candidatus Jacksonbacteria bacterium]
MQISYDPIADAMYIALTKKNKSTLTESVREDFLVDFNKGKPVGIEILDVSHKIPKRELENITFTVPTYKIDKLLR